MQETTGKPTSGMSVNVPLEPTRARQFPWRFAISTGPDLLSLTS
jgi:hypothetical protein